MDIAWNVKREHAELVIPDSEEEREERRTVMKRSRQ